MPRQSMVNPHLCVVSHRSFFFLNCPIGVDVTKAAHAIIPFMPSFPRIFPLALRRLVLLFRNGYFKGFFFYLSTELGQCDTDTKTNKQTNKQTKRTKKDKQKEPKKTNKQKN